MILPGCKKGEKPEWVSIGHTIKKLQKNDVYVLGDPTVRMPGIVSSSSIKGVKARLVCVKAVTRTGPPKAGDVPVKVLKEWSFDKDNQTKPLHFGETMQINSVFWIEMQNPNEEEAVVNSLIHGVIRSKAL